MTTSPLRILHLEDDPTDAARVREMLEGDALGCEVTRVASEAEFVRALDQGGVDVVLADLTLASFDGVAALRVTRKKRPDLPFIVVTGALGEHVAIETLRNGATDYVTKDRLSHLAPSVRRAVTEAHERAERKRAEEERQARLSFLESMDQINRAIQGTNDLDQMLAGALDAALSMFECDRASVWYPCDPEARSQRLLMQRTRREFPGLYDIGVEVPMDVETADVYRIVRAASAPVRFDPRSAHPMSTEMSTRLGSLSRMLMVLYPKGDQPYMFGLSQCSYARVWTAREERLFQEIGRRLEDALTSLLIIHTLGESQRKLEQAQRISHVGHWERDLAADLTTKGFIWSDETFHVFGLSPQARPPSFEEMQAIVHPADRERWATAVADVLRGPSRYDLEYRALKPDGEVVFIRSQGEVVRDDAGRPLRVFGTLQDITERKRAEAALRASEAALAEGQQISHTGSWRWNARTGELQESAEHIRIYGFDPSAGPRTQRHIRERLHPDDRAMVEKVIDDAVRERRAFACDGRIVRSDGVVKHLHVVGRPAVGASGQLEYVGTTQDITDRKQAEGRIAAQYTVAQALAEAATIEEAAPKILRAICECLEWDVGGLWRLDRTTELMRCVDVWHNSVLDVSEFEAATRRLTFKPGIGMPGRVWVAHGPVHFADVSKETYVQSDSTGVRVRAALRAGLHSGFGVPILLRDEVLGVIEFYSREIRELDDELLNVMATIGSQIGQYIERKRAEAALGETQAELARVARLTTMGELTASIAHEINQPLGAVVNNASACLRWLATQNVEEARRSVAMVIADGHRAADIIARIRALAAKAPPRKDWLDLNDTIRSVIAMARSELHSHGVVLQAELTGDLPMVLGDRIQLQQVMLNLMINAIEAMSAVGDGQRELVVRSARDGAHDVVVAVADSGPGLNPKGLDQLFEAFYTTKMQGLGLGLAISRRIIEAHAGRLWATANTPRGAVFQFTLPVGEARST